MKAVSFSVLEDAYHNRTSELAGHDRTNINQLLRDQFIGESAWAQKARGLIAAHAAHENPILIQGTTGTGKKFVARLIHQCSARRGGPFVTISCHNVSEESLEAALFGWIRELPSGRNRIQRGLVEAAHGGTLYMSGITMLSDVLKMRLVRLMQHQEFRRLGDQVLEEADVRVLLGAPDHSLAPDATLASQAWAISDIFFISPLCQRKVDIAPLIRTFTKRICQQTNRESRELSPDMLRVLQQYDWPGNVEELKHVVEGMIHKSNPPCLDLTLVPAHIAGSPEFQGRTIPAAGTDLSEELKQFERSLLCEALKRSQGKQSKAAQLLGLKLTTLNAKLARYNIDVRVFKKNPCQVEASR